MIQPDCRLKLRGVSDAGHWSRSPTLLHRNLDSPAGGPVKYCTTHERRRHSPRARTRRRSTCAVVQFLFVTCWTALRHLPAGAARGGRAARGATRSWILILDQLAFMVMDVVTGVAADRAGRMLGRIGPLIIGLTTRLVHRVPADPACGGLRARATPALLLALILVVDGDLLGAARAALGAARPLCGGAQRAVDERADADRARRRRRGRAVPGHRAEERRPAPAVRGLEPDAARHDRRTDLGRARCWRGARRRRRRSAGAPARLAAGVVAVRRGLPAARAGLPGPLLAEQRRPVPALRRARARCRT